MASFKIDAKLGDTKIFIGGNEITGVRSIEFTQDMKSAPECKLDVLLTKPIVVEGEGIVMIDAIPLTQEIGRQIYNTLKAMYEPDTDITTANDRCKVFLCGHCNGVYKLDSDGNTM